MNDEQHRTEEAAIDEAIKESFPASDPVAVSKTADDNAGVVDVPTPQPTSPPDDSPFPFPTSDSMDQHDQ